MNKNGQAAMEFFSTYGWVILIVCIAVGTLAHFGLLNPSKFLPNKCIMGTGFGCEDYKVTKSGSDSIVTVNIRNGIGSQILIGDGICLDGQDDASCGDITLTSATGACVANDENSFGSLVDTTEDAKLEEGHKSSWTWTCPNTASGSSKFKGELAMKYKLSGNSLSHTITGAITTNIE